LSGWTRLRIGVVSGIGMVGGVMLALAPATFAGAAGAPSPFKATPIGTTACYCEGGGWPVAVNNTHVVLTATTGALVGSAIVTPSNSSGFPGTGEINFFGRALNNGGLAVGSDQQPAVARPS
jgi:hypothetical protein